MMNETDLQKINTSLLNVNRYLSGTYKSNSKFNDFFKKYTFSWLGILDGNNLDVVFKTATPARFNNTSTYDISTESHDQIFFSVAIEALDSKQVVYKEINKHATFPSRRTEDPSFRALAAIPLKIDDKAYGVFCIYTDQNSIEQEEIAELKRLACDLVVTMNIENVEKVLDKIEAY